MDAVDGVVPPPARSRLAAATADAMVCLSLASMWVLLAGAAASLIGLLTCGMEECPEVIDAASTVILFAALSFVICGAVAALLLSKFVEPASYTDGSEKTAATQGIMDDTFFVVYLISTVAFAFIEIVGFLLNCFAARGSRMDRVASVIVLVAPLGMIAVNCFIFIPGFAVMMWRMRRFRCASRSAKPAILSYDMEQQVTN